MTEIAEFEPVEDLLKCSERWERLVDTLKVITIDSSSNRDWRAVQDLVMRWQNCGHVQDDQLILRHQWRAASALVAAKLLEPEPQDDRTAIDVVQKLIGTSNEEELAHKAYTDACRRVLDAAKGASTEVLIALEGQNVARNGMLARLVLECHSGLTADTFQHPHYALSSRVDRRFRDALAQAWKDAVELFQKRREPSRLPVGLWSLRRIGSDSGVPDRIAGSSAYGAALRGWLHVLEDWYAASSTPPGQPRCLDRRVLVIVDRTDTGLSSSGLGGKMKAVAAFNQDTAARKYWPAVDTILVTNDAVSTDLKVVRAASDGALKELVTTTRSRCAEQVREYLEGVLKEIELPPYYPDDLKDDRWKAFTKVRQNVDLIHEPQRLRELHSYELEREERLRAAGSDVFQYEPRRARPDDEPGKADERDARLAERTRSFPRPEPWTPELAERLRCAVVLGDPGFGKTWLLRYEAVRLARAQIEALEAGGLDLDSVVLPIFLKLDAVSTWLSQPAPGIPPHAPRGLVDRLRESLGSRAELGFLFESRLDQGGCVVLLDGLDEVSAARPVISDPLAPEVAPSPRERVIQAIKEFHSNASYRRNRLLLSSRLADYTPLQISGLQEAVLVAFDQAQVKAFAEVFLGGAAGDFLAALRASPSVSNLARVPLLLALLCATFSGKEFAAQRSELYRLCLLKLFSQHDARADLTPPVGNEELQDWIDQLTRDLARIAWQSFYEAAELNQDYMKKLRPAHLASLLKCGVLTASEITNLAATSARYVGTRTRYTFLHRTVHEYLAAHHLATLCLTEWKGIEPVIDRKSWDPQYEQVIVLLIGILCNENVVLSGADGDFSMDDRIARVVDLLKLLSDESTDDYFRHRLALATLATGEIPDAMLDAS